MNVGLVAVNVPIWWVNGRLGDEILLQLSFSLGLCHLREAMRTTQDLRSLSFVLRAL